MSGLKPMPAEMLECWSYDPLTGSIVWKKLRGERSPFIVGSPVHLKLSKPAAGSRVYYVVRFAKRDYFAHRVAWFLMTGRQPDGFIDHIDNNATLDNRAANLRIANASQNQANAKAKGERSLPKGVSLTPAGTYRAIIMVNRKQIGLGTYPAPELAARAYLSAAKQYFGEYARAA